MEQLPDTGLLRLYQIIGRDGVTPEQARANRKKEKGIRRPRAAVVGLIPVKRSTWWAGVKSGRYPKPTNVLGPRVTAWRVEDIRKLLGT